MLSAGIVVSFPTTMFFSDDGMHCSDAFEPNHMTSVLVGFS